MIFKDHLLQTQETFILKSRESHKNARRPIQMKKEILAKLKHKKKAIQNKEAGTGRLEGVQTHCLNMQKCSQESQSPPGAKTSEEGQE